MDKDKLQTIPKKLWRNKELLVHAQRILRKMQVKKLKRRGYGLRKIQRMLGYKSPESVSRILKE